VILVIDNYDSFTYNLVQALGVLGRGGATPRGGLRVFRNDRVTVDEVRALAPDRVILSPGPCTPKEAGVCVELVRALAPERVPILGVCLGHQCIGEAFGGEVVLAGRLMHGKTSEIEHDGKGVYRGLPNPFTATRYHSLVVREESLPDCLAVTARSADRGELMGFRHIDLPVEGVQFHPESFLTAEGPRLLANFVRGKA